MDHYSIVEPPSPDKERGGVPEEAFVPLHDGKEPAAAEMPLTQPAVTTTSEAETAPAAMAEARLSAPAESQPQPPPGDLDSSLQALVQKAQYTSNATGAALALRQGADVVCRAASGNSAPDRGARLQIKTGLTAECLRSGELLRCDNVMQDSRVDMESCRRLGIESIIIAPIRCGQNLVGVLELFSAHAYSFQERDVETVKALAAEIGKLLEQGEAPVLPAEPEPAPPTPVEEGQSTCSACGTKIANDAVFCTGCGTFQESSPAAPAEVEPLGWKARLSSRRLLVPAVFVIMALVVAVAPFPRQATGTAPAARPAVQAAATPAPGTPGTPAAHANKDSKHALTADAGNGSAAAAGAASAQNPTIAKSVKQLLGGVSSDFSKLLPVNEKAVPPSNGDPNLKVWVDTRKGYYYCPGEEQYGRTDRGSFMTQKEAESNYYIPALIKPCM
ncbi:MAG TPA: GAF domain-containing protein [Terriglobales bacterium]|nr:GAF domain-containing protein [Terriglobales bacterium]